MTPTPLDFADIRKACPRAFAALIGWFCQGKHFQLGVPTIDSPGYATAEWGPYLCAELGVLEVGDFRDQYTLNVRDLYDFFDASGVYVTIMGEHNPYEEETTFDSWITTFSIGERSKVMFCDQPTRAAAEAAAFTAGFAKLEEMLGKEEGR